MAAQKGKDVLIKIGDGASTEVFTTVGGLRSSSLSMNQETVDVTNKGSAAWRELLSGAGIRNASISGAGVFTDAASEASVRADFFDSVLTNYQFVVPDFGTFQGAFIVTSLEYAGEHNGEASYSMSFESAGAVAFTAV